jgi:hypothetical protein
MRGRGWWRRWGTSYSHNNLLIFLVGAESRGAVSGAGMICLSLYLGGQIAPKLSAPSRFPGIYSANLLAGGKCMSRRWSLGVWFRSW